MALRFSSSSTLLVFTLVLILLSKPAHAFGAGNIPEKNEFDQSVWKHGDIGEVLKYLPVSFITRYGFTKLEILQVYFGNWLRDYSQAIDIMMLGKMNEPTLRAIISILGFMEFGLTTDEFDITKARLGCYRPEEHIDNPKGYATKTVMVNGNRTQEAIPDSDIESLDSRLRKGVDEEKELAVDPKTGMKNYIANETIGITTSAGYLRQQLKECIEKGRSGRKGNESDKQEAFIHLGALLHTLEDFSAHSNYVELALQAIGVEEVFAFVGEKCRCEVPGTKKLVPPLVTGTFGSLDVYQSIIGEVDDKAAIRNKGLLGLNLKFGVGSRKKFEDIAAQISSALKFLVLLPGASGIKTDFENILSSVNSSEDSKPKQVDASGVTGGLWEAVSPVFAFHGKVKRFWIDNKDKLALPFIKDAIEAIGDAIDELTYAALAIIIETAVNTAREAIKEGKEAIEEEDRASHTYVDIFHNDSDSSDPSHSILAKDHFSNYLNPIAGRVATATTNWTTQRVAECWDSDDDGEIESKINSILEILHHPSFALAKKPTFIQETMFDIVKQWWSGRNEQQKQTLRSVLCKEGIKANGDGHVHGDNNPATETISVSGVRGYALDWAGSKPSIKEKEDKSLGQQIINLINGAVKAIDDAKESLEKGVEDASKLIDEGLSAADKAINDAADGLGKTLKRGFDEFVEGGEEIVDEVGRGTKKVFDDATRLGQQALDDTTEVVGGAVDTVEHAAKDVVHKGEEIVEGVGDVIQDGANKVTETAKDVVNVGGEVVKGAADFVSDVGGKTGEVASDVFNKLTGWW